MMLFPVAGSRIFIADRPEPVRALIPRDGWQEIGSATSFGMIGGAWSASRAFYGNGSEVMKGDFSPGNVQIILGADAEDLGQAVLWKAFHSKDHFPFRIVFPDGWTWRAWSGAVIGMNEVFQEANSIIALQTEIMLSSHVYRDGRECGHAPDHN